MKKKGDLISLVPSWVSQRSRSKNNKQQQRREEEEEEETSRSVLFLPVRSVFLDGQTALKTNLKRVPLVGILFSDTDRDLVLKTHFFRRETGEIIILISLVLVLKYARVFRRLWRETETCYNKRERKIRERTFTTARRRRRRKKQIE